MKTYHPMYESEGGVPAIEEVRFSLIHNRGCFGGCNFCSLSFHQGRAGHVAQHRICRQGSGADYKNAGLQGLYP